MTTVGAGNDEILIYITTFPFHWSCQEITCTTIDIISYFLPAILSSVKLGTLLSRMIKGWLPGN